MTAQHRLPPTRLGATPTAHGTEFAVWSATADSVAVSLFDATGNREVRRVPLIRHDDGVFHATVDGVTAGTRYGLRADGRYAPEAGLWFDPAKLLIDPYAVTLDRAFVYDPRLAAPRGEPGAADLDTAPLVPKAIVTALPPPLTPRPPTFEAGGLIYEVAVRAYTMRHPDVPPELRGTVAALAHPAVIAHLRKLRVAALELMPLTACIDERHLAALGLRNAWGYNPISFMALDPRLAPGGLLELRTTVAALQAAGIAIILDVVFNHTGESDAAGPVLSLRGLDNATYYRHAERHVLVNDTGCGNTLACDRPPVRRLILDSLRLFVETTGVDGFRFDLATVLGRTDHGFDSHAALFSELAADPLLADRVMIAEPWDIGPGGYQLGRFSHRFLEWNDRARDDVRRFWRGDGGAVGDLATRLAGSSDIFGRAGLDATRSVSFIAAHDGFTVADVVAYASKHNDANGEKNRDGTDDNHSWNHGVEGPSSDAFVQAARRRDQQALLATLFATRGTIMLTAGDEFGRTQDGNNNAYCQDNATVWLDWQDRPTFALVIPACAMRGSWSRPMSTG
jgi:glycogen operon protein